MKLFFTITCALLCAAPIQAQQVETSANVFETRQLQLKTDFLSKDFNLKAVPSPLFLRKEGEGTGAGLLIVSGLILSALPIAFPDAGTGIYVLSGLGGTLLIAGVVVAVSNSEAFE